MSILNFQKWTSLGLNQGPPDYESVALIGCKGTLFPSKIQIFFQKDTKFVAHLWRCY